MPSFPPPPPPPPPPPSVPNNYHQGQTQQPTSNGFPPPPHQQRQQQPAKYPVPPPPRTPYSQGAPASSSSSNGLRNHQYAPPPPPSPVDVVAVRPPPPRAPSSLSASSSSANSPVTPLRQQYAYQTANTAKPPLAPGLVAHQQQHSTQPPTAFSPPPPGVTVPPGMQRQQHGSLPPQMGSSSSYPPPPGATHNDPHHTPQPQHYGAPLLGQPQFSQQQQPPPYSKPQHRPQPPPYNQPTTSYSTNTLSSSSETLSLDPSQLPRPHLFTEPTDTAIPPVYHPRSALLHGDLFQPPPPPNTRFYAPDDGNASPYLIRSTVYAFPAQRGTWHKSGDIPLGLTCTPLQMPSDDFWCRPKRLLLNTTTTADWWKHPQRIPVLDVAPPRCRHCQAYMNPFCLDNQQVSCNLCGKGNNPFVTSSSNSSSWSWNGNDQDNRNIGGGLPLQMGTVEYQVGGAYLTRAQPVQTLYLLYALDLTCPYLVSYLPMLERLGHDLAAFWQQQNNDNRRSGKISCPRMGICLVSSIGVVMRRHNATGTTNNDVAGHYAVMSDVTQDPFNPLPVEEWSVDLSTGVHDWSELCRQILPQEIAYWKQQASAKNAYGLDGLEQSCGGAALQFLANALEETGGRGIWITWKRPNFGVGALPFRQEKQQQQQTSVEDVSVYTPIQLQKKAASDSKHADVQEFYKALGSTCAKNRVSLSVVMHTPSPGPNQFYDLATLGELCRVTCGQLIWLTSKQNWEETMYQELSRHVYSFAGWDAVFKVRCSDGVLVKSFLSPNGVVVDGDTIGGSPELELSCVSPNTSISVEIEHRVGGLPKDSRFVYFQTALLYTNVLGERRVRVSTLALKTTLVVDDVFRSADLATTMTHLILGSYRYLRTIPSEDESASPIRKARDALYYRCLDILVNFRLNTPAITSPSAQLILPERLQLLPLACMCLHKTPMLRPSLPRRLSGMVSMCPSGDQRAYYTWHLSQSTPGACFQLLYPSVFSISDEIGDIGELISLGGGESRGVVRMPQPLSPSMSSLQDEGAYLIDDGLSLYIYIGKAAPDSVRNRLISFDSSEAVQGDELSERLHRLIWQIRAYSCAERGGESELRPTVSPVVIVQQRDGHQGPGESDILDLMVNDATSGEKDYSTFMSTMHRRMRDRLLANKK